MQQFVQQLQAILDPLQEFATKKLMLASLSHALVSTSVILLSKIRSVSEKSENNLLGK